MIGPVCYKVRPDGTKVKAVNKNFCHQRKTMYNTQRRKMIYCHDYSWDDEKNRCSARAYVGKNQYLPRRFVDATKVKCERLRKAQQPCPRETRPIPPPLPKRTRKRKIKPAPQRRVSPVSVSPIEMGPPDFSPPERSVFTYKVPSVRKRQKTMTIPKPKPVFTYKIPSKTKSPKKMKVPKKKPSSKPTNLRQRRCRCLPIGTRQQVMSGVAEKTIGGLKKRDLAINKNGTIVAKSRQAHGKTMFRRNHLRQYMKVKEC